MKVKIRQVKCNGRRIGGGPFYDVGFYCAPSVHGMFDCCRYFSKAVYWILFISRYPAVEDCTVVLSSADYFQIEKGLRVRALVSPHYFGM